MQPYAGFTDKTGLISKDWNEMGARREVQNSQSFLGGLLCGAVRLKKRKLNSKLRKGRELARKKQDNGVMDERRGEETLRVVGGVEGR